MTRIRRCLVAVLAASGLSVALFAADSKPAAPYANDFSQLPVGRLTSKDLFVLNGTFAVAEADGNKSLELPGNPLDTFGVLFGPEAVAAVDVSARIYGTNDGKMFPEFGVGADNAGGYKLWALPGQNALVLRKAEQELARIPFKWTSGTWTHFHLQLSAAPGGKWTISGKAWPAGQKEPEAWMISTTETTKAPEGRASVWGQPYSGTPIRFDDLSVTPK